MTDRICPECGTKVTHLYEQGDCMYSIDLLADDAKEEFDDHHNVGYEWYCTDKSCNAGTDGWFGDRTDCPPKADEIEWERHKEPPKGEIAELMKSMIMKNLDIPELDLPE